MGRLDGKVALITGAARGQGRSHADEFGAAFQTFHTLPVPWVDKNDISSAALYLASDDCRYVTGLTLYVDAGFITKVG